MEDEEKTGGSKERGQVRGNKDNTGPSKHTGSWYGEWSTWYENWGCISKTMDPMLAPYPLAGAAVSEHGERKNIKRKERKALWNIN